jgi:hypothetical protein
MLFGAISRVSAEDFDRYSPAGLPIVRSLTYHLGVLQRLRRILGRHLQVNTLGMGYRRDGTVLLKAAECQQRIGFSMCANSEYRSS